MAVSLTRVIASGNHLWKFNYARPQNTTQNSSIIMPQKLKTHVVGSMRDQRVELKLFRIAPDAELQIPTDSWSTSGRPCYGC